jgi:hypothetical protein
MTVSSTPRKAGPLSGNGVVTAFPFSFKVFSKNDVTVALATPAGVETILVLDSDYSVTLNSNQDVSPGGTVTYPITGSPLPTGSTLTIVGDLAYSQATQLPTGGAYNAVNVETALDRVTILAQQLLEKVGRALSLPISTATGVSATLPVPVANQAIGWNSSGSGLANLDPASLATDILYGQTLAQTFSGNGSQTQFVLSSNGASVNNVQAFISGVRQRPVTDYLLNAVDQVTVTFDVAPPAGTNNILFVWQQALAAGTVADSSVTTPKIVDGAVTTPKIADGSVTEVKLADDARRAIRAQQFGSGTTAGTGTAYTLTVTPTVTSYAANQTFWVTFHAASGASPTLQISGLASPPNLVRYDSTGALVNIAASEIPANFRGRVTLVSTTQALVEEMPPAAATAVRAPIQPISASVASNNLTVSASALTLDFRSTTLGSGTVTTVSGTPANLVVPSGATLGTVSAVQSDIVVLALNNAGTLELAVVNIAGGVDLSETGLISTTAISAGSTSASTVYSTTGRTNVAYRVIGVVRSTQTTAGTWSTAPSLIQGQGGQALAAMQSLGYGQTWQNVTGSRVASTTYYNTTGRPILVSIASRSSSTTNLITATVNGSIIVEAYSYFNTGSATYPGNLVFIVPPGGSYSVAVSNYTIQYWSELR